MVNMDKSLVREIKLNKQIADLQEELCKLENRMGFLSKWSTQMKVQNCGRLNEKADENQISFYNVVIKKMRYAGLGHLTMHLYEKSYGEDFLEFTQRRLASRRFGIK